MTSKNTWGGKRAGAGRPQSSEMIPHTKRPEVGNKRPLFIVIKIRKELGSIRHPEFFKVFERSSLRAKRFGLRIIHFAILNHKIQLLVEIKKQEELHMSFKSLNTSLAIHLKKKYFQLHGQKHHGPVLLGRFQMTVLEDPQGTKDKMKKLYLEAAWEQKKRNYPDHFSSAPIFHDWQALLQEEWTEDFNHEFTGEEIKQTKTICSLPQFWLNQSGWKS